MSASDHSSDRSSGRFSAKPETTGVLYFGPFAFDLACSRLSRDGIEMHLTPKAAAVLGLLLQRPGELISKDEFLETVWEGVHVREESLTQAISVIRQALGDAAQSPLYIRTVSGEGYRFIGEVEVAQASTEAPRALDTPANSAAESVAGQRPRVVRRAGDQTVTQRAPRRAVVRRGLAAAAVIVAVVAASVYLLAPPADPDPPTIVVLPATVIGQTEEQQLFAAGIGDELATKLALVVPGVVPYSVAMSYDRTDKTWAQIDEHFEADYILEMTVRFGSQGSNRFRLVGRLRRASDGLQLTEVPVEGAIDTAYFFEQQGRVAIEVLETLSLSLPIGERQTLLAWPTDNLEAWREYVRGMEKMRHSIYEWSNWEEAITHLEEAVSLDPDYVVAQSMLSRAWSLEGNTEQRRKARDLALRLVDDHSEVPQAHWALGFYYYWWTRGSGEPLGDPETLDRRHFYALAMQHLDEARRGLPYSPDLEKDVAWVKGRQGDWDTTIAILARLHRLQPDATGVMASLSHAYLVTRRHAEAEELIDKQLEANPEAWAVYVLKALNHLAWGQPIDRLREELRSAPVREFSPENPIGRGGTCQVLFAWVLADAAERKYEDLLARIDAVPQCTGGWAGNMVWDFGFFAGLAYRALGDEAAALKAVDERRTWFEERAQVNPVGYGINATTGLLHAMAGRREQALYHAERAVALRPVAQDAFQGTEPLQFYVRTLTQLGEIDRAIEQLDYLLSVDSFITIPFVRNDPLMEAIVEDPRFQELAAKYPPPGRSADGGG